MVLFVGLSVFLSVYKSDMLVSASERLGVLVYLSYLLLILAIDLGSEPSYQQINESTPPDAATTGQQESAEPPKVKKKPAPKKRVPKQVRNYKSTLKIHAYIRSTYLSKKKKI